MQNDATILKQLEVLTEDEPAPLPNPNHQVLAGDKSALLSGQARILAAEKTSLLSRIDFSDLQPKVFEWLTGIIVPLILFILWDAATRNLWVKAIFLPAPLAVVNSFIDVWKNDRFMQDLWVSIYTVIRGFAYGAFFGLLFGTVAGLSKTVERLFAPLLNAIRQVPAIAFLPLIILWIGIGDFGKLVVLGKAVFFPVFLNTLQGIRSVNKEYVEVAQVYEFSRIQLIRRVIFPAALPTIFVGIRFGAGISWAMLVMAEMISGRKGLGYVLTRGQELLMTDQVFVVIFIIGAIGFLIDVGLRQVEGHLVSWKKSIV